MTKDQRKSPEAAQAEKAARTERIPRVPDHASDDDKPVVTGGRKPDTAMCESRNKPGIVDKSEDC